MIMIIPSQCKEEPRKPEFIYLFVYFVHLIGYWSLSELRMGTAGNTPRWVAILLQGPRSIFWGLGTLLQGPWSVLSFPYY